ncbi:MAG: hypothetical protein ROW48_08800 [Bellilinea sp.]|jgi:hypothetical protein
MKNPVDKLINGLDEAQRQELGDLSSLARFLESDALPDPRKEEVARLMAALEPYLPGSSAAQSRPAAHWLRLVHSQLILFESSFWLSGVLVVLLGLFITVLDGRELLPLALVLLAPLLAVAGVAYIFRPETRTLRELERLTATAPAELLFSRLALVLAFNLLVSLLLLFLTWVEGAQVVLWRLALAWLGPMLMLAGLALYSTIRWGLLIGTLLPMISWVSLVVMGWRKAILHTAEGMTVTAWLLVEISRSNPVLIGSILACLAGTGLVILVGRSVVGERQSWS